MIDYGALLLDPIYESGPFSVSATLDTGDTGGPFTVTVLDKTKGIETAVLGRVDLATIMPAAMIRVAELTGLGLMRADLKNATLTMNGADWIIRFTEVKPVPSGEADGEYYLLLEASA